MKTRHILLALFALIVLALSVCYHGYYAWNIGEPVGATLRYSDGSGERLLEKRLSEAETAQLLGLLQRCTPTLINASALYPTPGMEDFYIKLHYADGSSRLFTVWHGGSMLFEGDALHMRYKSMIGNDFPLAGNLPDDFRSFAGPYIRRPQEMPEKPRRPLVEELRQAPPSQP